MEGRSSPTFNDVAEERQGADGTGARGAFWDPRASLHSGTASPLGFAAASVASFRLGDGPASPASISPRGSIATMGSAYPGASPRKPARKPGDSKNFKVVVRVRPPLPRELANARPFQSVVAVDRNEHVLSIGENVGCLIDEDSEVSATAGSTSGTYNTHVFTFDYVYDQTATQRKVYDTTAMEVVDSALEGYNATIFAYGQTSSGKTFTMEGGNRQQGPRAGTEQRGIIPRAIEQVFGHIQAHASTRVRFLVRASYLQIYNEVISDLLKPERANLAIREDRRRGVFVEGLSEWVVRNPKEIYGLMARGAQLRATGATRMNEMSSRSHAVFIIIVEQSETSYVDEDGEELGPEEMAKAAQQAQLPAGVRNLESRMRQTFKVGKLNLVDLAGSERVRLSGATGQRLEESKKINQSLSALGNVIAALTDPRGRQHIPYRDSKLTRILEDSLGGNCKTTMMAMISPALESMLETLSTVKFASRAKNIRNEPVVNEDLDQKSLLRKYERELKRLRAELEERSRNVVDQRQVLQLEEERRRAEADKMAAIRALEARSREFLREKEEKRRLEERIALLTGQMIRGTRAAAAAAAAHAGARGNGGGAANHGLHQGQGAAAAVTGAGGVDDLNAIVSEEQERLRKEYAGRLAALEQERESIEEEKAQVDRYKQLLLKQRDIMFALTQRLNAREEVIMALQDELDESADIRRELEENLDEKTAQLIHLQRAILEHNATAPDKSSDLVEALGWETAAMSPVPEEEPAVEEADLPIFDAASAAYGSRSQREDASADTAAGEASVDGAASVDAAQARAEAANGDFSMDRTTPVTFRTSAGGIGGGASNGAAAPVRSAWGLSHEDVGEIIGGAAVAARNTSTGHDRRASSQGEVAELLAALEQSQAEAAALSRELESVQAEKVSMEFLLREKLERLVQAEIEGRLSSMGLPAASAAALLDGQLAVPPALPQEPLAAVAADRLLPGSLSAHEQNATEENQSQSVVFMAGDLALARQDAATWAAEAERLRAELTLVEARAAAGGVTEQQQRPLQPQPVYGGWPVVAGEASGADEGLRMGTLVDNGELPQPTAVVEQSAAAAAAAAAVAGTGTEAEVTRLRAENALLLDRLGRAEAAAAAAPAATSGGGSAHSAAAAAADEGVLAQLEERCQLLCSERHAVQTILEQKIKVLVENVADSLQELMAEESGDDGIGEVRRALEKDVAALRSLLDASIQALQHAAQEDLARAQDAGASASDVSL